MARNLTTQANVEISMNGKKANEVMKLLREQAKGLKSDIKKAEGAADNITAQRLKKELREVNTYLNLITTSTTKVEHVLRNLDTATTKQLKSARNTLRKLIGGVERGSEEWKKLASQIRLVEAELSRVNKAIHTQESGWKRMNRWLNDTQTFLMGAAAAMTGFVMAGRKAVNEYTEYDETLAETRKFTGMTASEVKNLNKEIKAIDTRSPIGQLNALAQEAGRLGKTSHEAVMGYTEAADIINVALSDLGEGATQEIAKIANIFGIEQQLGTKQAMLAIGSAVNSLSQNCVASAPYLVDFAQRMAGIGAQAGLTVPQILAFGAVLDANGQKVEMSATAIQKIIMALANKNKEFSKVLGLDAEELAKTLNRSAKDGILMYLDAIRSLSDKTSANNATTALAPLFKDMGMDAARVATVLSTLANHVEEVRWQLGEADKAFEEATSATNEYTIFNNTAQASIDKARKRLSELAVELGEKLYPIMKHVYTSSSLFIRVLNQIVSFLLANSREIATLAISIGAYTVAVNLATLKTKLFAAAQITAASGVNRLRAALSALKAHPLALVTAAVAALVSAIVSASRKASEWRREMDHAMKSATSFAAETAKERREVDRLVGALEGARKGTKEYDDARKSIISKYGTYLKGLVDEKGEIMNLALAYDRLTFAAQKSARARSIGQAREKLDQSYFEKVDTLTEELRGSLAKMQMPERDIERIVTQVSQRFAAGQSLPSELSREIMAFQSEHLGIWQNLAGDSPMKIIRKLYQGRKDYDKRTSKLDSMDSRLLSGMATEDIDSQIEHISKQLAVSGVDRIDVEVSLSGKESARSLTESISQGIRTPDFGKGSMVTTPIPGQTAAPATLPTQATPSTLTTDNRQLTTPITQLPSLSIMGAPMAGAGKAAGSLTRGQAENLLRELMYERSQRPAAMATKQGGEVETAPEYESEKDRDARLRKEAAEARKEAVKARKDFKDGLEAIKAAANDRESDIARAYSGGDIGYEDYLKRKKDSRMDYFNESIKYYEENLGKIKDIEIREDKDYSKLLKDREEAEISFNAKITEYRAKQERSKARIAENELEAQNESGEKSLQSEILYLREKMQLHIKYLKAEQALYAEGSKEWEDIQMKIEEESASYRLESEKLLSKRVAEMKKKYAETSSLERYRMELEVLKRLYDAEKITVEQFWQWRRKLDLEYAQLSQKEKEKIAGMDYRRTPSEMREQAEKEYRQKISEIDSAEAKGTISPDEARRARRKVKDDSLTAPIDKLRQSDQWVAMIADLYTSWDKLIAEMSLGWENLFQNIEDVAKSTFAVVGAVMQYNAQMAEANARIELAALEKRYSREIELAQGNSYLTAKLEKEKEKKKAEIKNKASRASYNMQVTQAVAQAITGAMNAYTSTAAIHIVGPALAPVAAAVALAAGMANVALIKKQQQAAEASGYAEGGFTRPGAKHEVAGVVHAGEWVASKRLVDSPRTRPLIDMLEQAQRSNTIGSLSPADTSWIIGTGAAALSAATAQRPIQIPTPPTQTPQPNADNRQLKPDTGPDSQTEKILSELSQTVARLAARLEEPFVTVNTVDGPYGIKKAQDDYNRLMANKNRRK